MRTTAVTLVMAAMALAQDKPALDVGYRWRYESVARDGGKKTQTVTAMAREKLGERECLRVETRVEGDDKPLMTEWIVADASSMRCLKFEGFGMSSTYDQAVTQMKFPPKAGDKWTDTVSADGYELTFDTEVGAEEEIKVPAGTYKAFKTVTRLKGAHFETKWTLWWTKDGTVVQSEDDERTTRLVKFEKVKP